MRSADRIIAATTLEREQMQSLYDARPARIAIVPPGWIYPSSARCRARGACQHWAWPPDHSMVLFVGRIQPSRALTCWIRAMALLLQRNRRCATRPAWSSSAVTATHAADEEMLRLDALRASWA